MEGVLGEVATLVLARRGQEAQEVDCLKVALQGAGAQHGAGTGRSKEGRVGETRGFPEPATATPAPATAPVPSSVLAPSPGDP